MTWGDDPQWETMPRGEWFIFDMGGQQKVFHFVEREATSVAGRGADQETAGVALYPGPLQRWTVYQSRVA